MSYSKNIEILTNQETFNPKLIIDNIQKQVTSGKQDAEVYKLPESIGTPSLEFAQGSPAYQPDSEEYEKLKGEFNELGSSPAYNPYSNSSEEELEEGQIYSPHSPEEPPPNFGGESQSNDLDILKEQAQTFNEGEVVHYRGDTRPERIWKIREIGPMLITIETDNINELNGMDSTQYVTALDIYRPGDFVNAGRINMGGSNLPYAEPINTFAQPTNMGTPPIHFAPVFKIVNGGSDFSTDGMGDMNNSSNSLQPTDNNLFNSPMIKGPQEIKVKQDGGSAEPKEEKSGSSIWDLGKMLIKKVGM